MTTEIRIKLDGSNILWNPREESYVLVNNAWYQVTSPVTIRFIDSSSTAHFQVRVGGPTAPAVDLPHAVTVDPHPDGVELTFSCTKSDGTTVSRAGRVYVGHTVKSGCRTPGLLDPVAAVLEPLIEAGSALLGQDVELNGGPTVCIPKNPRDP